MAFASCNGWPIFNPELCAPKDTEDNVCVLPLFSIIASLCFFSNLKIRCTRSAPKYGNHKEMYLGFDILTSNVLALFYLYNRYIVQFNNQD